MDKVFDFFYAKMDKISDIFNGYMTTDCIKVYIEPKEMYVIPFEEVMADRNDCIEFIENYFNNENNKSNKEIALAMYCNFNINSGMAGRFLDEEKSSDYDGLEKLFLHLKNDEKYFIKIYNGVKYQDDNTWDEVLKINKESIVAKIYKFLRLSFNYGQEIKNKVENEVIDVDLFEEMWEIYNSMPSIWKDYVLGHSNKIRKSDNNPVIDTNFLPYAFFSSTKEILIKHITDYYNEILEKLNVDKKIEPGDAFSEILQTLLNAEKKYDSIQLDFAFLCEKLHRLLSLKELKMEWSSGEVLEEYNWKNMYPALRCDYLHLHVQIETTEDLFISHYETYLKNKKLKKIEKQKKKLVNHLAHSWGNECYPEIVKKVADELLKNGKNSLANKLFKAYNSENNLLGEIIFLQAAMDDEPGTLKEIFSNSFYISGNGSKEKKVGYIIEDTLEILIFGLLNDAQIKEKRKKCCNNISTKYSIRELAEDYSKRFEDKNPSVSFLKWFSDNIMELEIDIDETWRKVNFGKTEYGKIILKNIFSELFTNVILHGGRKCKIALTSSSDKLYIEMKNLIGEEYRGGQKGLSALKEIISSLNYNTIVSEDESLRYGITDDDMYFTKITFAKELMYIDEDW